jgi:hypothetical protein
MTKDIRSSRQANVNPIVLKQETSADYVTANIHIMKVLFIDDRLNEIASLWKSSGCANTHELLPLEQFRSVERALELVATHSPDVVIVGFGLGRWPVTGADVIRGLQDRGFSGEIVGNSGGGPSQYEQHGIHLRHVNRTPQLLAEMLTGCGAR